MSAACHCPEVPAHPVPGPVTCGCCGRALELTCPGACGEEHVRAAIQRAAPVSAAGAAPVDVIARRRTRASYASKVCDRGDHQFQPSGPRHTTCDACLTPEELRIREMRRRANAKYHDTHGR